jgi:predicted CXXCH cytochrome family protein
MKLFPRRINSNACIFGGLALWGLLTASCVMVDRPMVAPPQIAGAVFVGSNECKECHSNVVNGFEGATHARLKATTDHDKSIGCESCHGPGSKHVEAGGGAGTIVNPSSSPETCFQCHLDKRAEFALPSAHPVQQGKISCNDCHEPHRGDATLGGGTQLAAANETCFKCHSAQRGPYVFEHEASREGCVSCHNPHGSVNDKLLKARNQSLCLQCHYQQQTIDGQLMIGGRDHRAFVSRGTCWSAGCHEAVHGSHVNSSLRF